MFFLKKKDNHIELKKKKRKTRHDSSAIHEAYLQVKILIAGEILRKRFLANLLAL